MYLLKRLCHLCYLISTEGHHHKNSVIQWRHYRYNIPRVATWAASFFLLIPKFYKSIINIDNRIYMSYKTKNIIDAVSFFNKGIVLCV